MLTFYSLKDNTLQPASFETQPASLPFIWIDLLDPTRDEELAVERLMALNVPTRDEMNEIEFSSRFYVERGSVVMTLPILTRSTAKQPESAAITFILSRGCLITVRYADPSAFSVFARNAAAQPGLALSGEQVMLGLLEQIADRLADVSEATTSDLEKLSHQIFHIGDTEKTDFKQVLTRIGHAGDIATRAKDSLLGLNRLILFFVAHTDIKKDCAARIDTLLHDTVSIDEHARFLSEKVGFLLNACMGMLNIEQNNIIKLFSVAAVAFMPPTLIASIYGMNFHHMPELDWELGYPCAILAMLASALLPVLYFKRKGWL